MKNTIKNKFAKIIVTGAVLTSALGLSFGANASAATSSTQTTSSSQVYTSDVVKAPNKSNVALTTEDRVVLERITGEKVSANAIGDKFHISQYFTKSQSAKIADRSSKWSTTGQFISGVNLILGSKPLSVTMYFSSNGIANNTKIFKTAKAKGKGVQISYTYTITRNSFGDISNTKIVYK